MNWIAYGLRRGRVTLRYPLAPASMPDAYRGAVEVLAGASGANDAATACLSSAIRGGAVDALRCFQCGECVRRAPQTFRMTPDFELARVSGDAAEIRVALAQRARAFGRSVNVRHVDAGSDGSEEQELSAIFNPFYDANRLGIFLTAAPRHADLLMVSGVVTHDMAEPLRRAYEAMPEPKVVVALGTSACSGGIFAQSASVRGPVSDVLPVDVFIPGAPPAPLTILHGIWAALGRALAKRLST